MRRRLQRFFEHEAAAGMVMLAAGLVAMVLANSSAAALYQSALEIHLGPLSIMHIISDVLMPIFFLKVGLELKEEMQDGALATKSQRTLPLIAAIGGIILPALIYLAITANEPSLRAGWAIPTATDIAFAICIVTLAGKHVPPAAKIFLLAIAIYDDIAAILIIAFFYADAFAWMPAIAAAMVVWVMVDCRHNQQATPLILLLAVGLGVLLHKAGIHSTVAGIVAGLCIPKDAMKSFSHRIDGWVAFGILPVFALANAGIPLDGLQITTLAQPLPFGIMLGLFLGKQLGIFGATMLAVKLGMARMPKATSPRILYGIAITAGIGFTMSLFIGQLAFTDTLLQRELKLGVLAASMLAALAGLVLLRIPDKH